MFLMLAASGIDFDAQLDELHELDAADEDLSEGAAWSNNPEYWERIKETLLKYSSSKDVKLASQEWTSAGHVFVQHEGTCELCGKTPISFHFPIQNKVTKRKLVVGNECVRNYQHLAGKVDLSDLQKRIRRQKDLLRSGKGTQENLSDVEELYQTEKQLRAKLVALTDSSDLDIEEYRIALQSAEQVGQILRVQSASYTSGRKTIEACRAYLKFQNEVNKRQKLDVKNIADLITAIMRQRKGDYVGQIGQLNQLGRLMGALFAAGRPNEVISRMWGAVKDVRDLLVQQVTVRADEARAKMMAIYSDELALTKPYQFLHFTISSGLIEHRRAIMKKSQEITASLLSEEFFDDVKAQRSLPVASNHQFFPELNYGEGNAVRAAWNVCQFLDLVRKGFLRNVITSIEQKFGVTVKDVAGVTAAMMRAADDSIVDADADGPACVGKFVQLLQAGDHRILDLVKEEVNEVQAQSERKVHEQMSLDLGIDVPRVFKVYAAPNAVENGMMTAILKKTWPAGRKLSPAQMSNIEKQLMKFARVKERPNSMWAYFKNELNAPYGGSK